LVFLGLAVMGIEWRWAGEALRRADWRYLLPAGAALLGYLLTRSARWRVLLGSRVGLGRAFSVINIGYLISTVLPFRLGDPALTIVALLAATIPFVGDVGWTREAGLAAAAMSVLAMGLLVLLAFQPSWGRRTLDWVVGHLQWVDGERWLRSFDGLLEGVAALRSLDRTVALIGWSVATWALTVVHYLAIMRAFMDRPSVVAASFLTCATALGVALPSSPGAMGVFHSVARFALQIPFGVTAETAVVIAFASHAFQYVTMCGLGLVGLLSRNLSFGRLRAEATVRAVGSTVSAKE
jgi:hypothetical protein